MPCHAPRPAPAGKPTKMSKNNPVAAYVYKNRLIAKRILASLTRALPASWGRMLRTMAEKAAFRLSPEYQGDTLPPIFHYWSENHVAPLLKRHGFASPEDFYLKRIEAERTLKRRELRILSIGSGACHLEIELVKKLRELGHNPHLECLDLNGALMAYQDKNGDGKMNRLFGMIPQEPYALSRNPQVFGKPKFSDAAVQARDGESIILKLHD